MSLWSQTRDRNLSFCVIKERLAIQREENQAEIIVIYTSTGIIVHTVMSYIFFDLSHQYR